MFSDATTMRVMANKYRRLAKQQTDSHERDKYRAYANIYFEMALRFQRQSDLMGWERRRSPAGATRQVRSSS
jgi:hypothetical protein